MALAFAGSSAVSASSNNGLPPNHPPVGDHLPGMPMHPTVARFSSQLRCPYAKEWLAKGAHRAAIDLGLTSPEKIESAARAEDYHLRSRRRHLQEAGDASIQGSCSFNNPWSGPSCLEFRGEGWTSASMEERCAVEPESTLAPVEGCLRPPELAGWCLKEGSVANSIEATSMMISSTSDCDGNKMACETFVGGAFEFATGCVEEGAAAPPMGDIMGGEKLEYADMRPPNNDVGDTKCIIAPGESKATSLHYELKM